MRIGALIAAATLVLILLLGLRALPATRSLAIWVVLLTAIALRELVRSLDRSGEPKSGFEQALGQRVVLAPERSTYAGMEREIELSTLSADHTHRRLVPLLRAAAAARLAMRHGIDLERRPDLARERLDAQTWDLIRPDRPVPLDRHAHGPQEVDIAAAVTSIEAL